MDIERPLKEYKFNFDDFGAVMTLYKYYIKRGDYECAIDLIRHCKQKCEYRIFDLAIKTKNTKLVNALIEMQFDICDDDISKIFDIASTVDMLDMLYTYFIIKLKHNFIPYEYFMFGNGKSSEQLLWMIEHYDGIHQLKTENVSFVEFEERLASLLLLINIVMKHNRAELIDNILKQWQLYKDKFATIDIKYVEFLIKRYMIDVNNCISVLRDRGFDINTKRSH